MYSFQNFLQWDRLFFERERELESQLVAYYSLQLLRKSVVLECSDWFLDPCWGLSNQVPNGVEIGRGECSGNNMSSGPLGLIACHLITLIMVVQRILREQTKFFLM